MSYIIICLLIYLMLVLFFWSLCTINKKIGMSEHQINVQELFSSFKKEVMGFSTDF